MMKPAFDDSGLATRAGDIRVYYYDSQTKEYVGWSDEYIHEGVSLPGNSTSIKPPKEEDGKVFVFEDSKWVKKDDNRGKLAYSIVDMTPHVIDTIGVVGGDYTMEQPETPYDKWDGTQWVTDEVARKNDEIANAERKKRALVESAIQSVTLIQLKLQAGRKLTEDETKKLDSVLDYIDSVNATDTSAADIEWPDIPGDL